MAKSAFAVFTPDKIEAAMDLVKNVVLTQTAADIRSKAIRSITHVDASGKGRGGKRNLKRMASGLHSKPGRPPYSRKNKVNQIVYEVVDDNTIIVGPRQFAGGHGFTWHLLEAGGTIQVAVAEEQQTQERTRRKFVRRGTATPRKKPKRKQKHPRPRTDPRIHETIPGPRPKGARGYQYQYFTSRGQWDAASEAPGFLRWARATDPPSKKRKTVNIAARPFMAPAFEKETEATRLTKRIERASRKARLR